MVIYNSPEGAQYLGALAPLMPVMFLDTVTDSILKGLGKQFYTMCVNIVDAAISVVLVWLLVPRIGIYGYIIVIYSSECVNTVFSIWKLLSIVDLKVNVAKILLSPLAAAIGAANVANIVFSLAALPQNAASLVLKCLFFAACYFGLSAMLGGVGREEGRWIKGVFAGGK